MKKLGKLKLNDARIMNDREMKTVIGGYGGYGTYGNPYQLPEITINGNNCDSLRPCSSITSGLRCGELCYSNGKTGHVKAFPDGASACKVCWLG